METLKTVWAFPLFTFSDGNTILVSQLVLIALLIGVGYLVSKLIERLTERRLAKTDLRADAAHILQRRDNEKPGSSDRRRATPSGERHGASLRILARRARRDRRRALNRQKNLSETGRS